MYDILKAIGPYTYELNTDQYVMPPTKSDQFNIIYPTNKSSLV